MEVVPAPIFNLAQTSSPIQMQKIQHKPLQRKCCAPAKRCWANNHCPPQNMREDDGCDEEIERTFGELTI